jgi:hypothetical protein
MRPHSIRPSGSDRGVDPTDGGRHVGNESATFHASQEGASKQEAVGRFHQHRDGGKPESATFHASQEGASKQEAVGRFHQHRDGGKTSEQGELHRRIEIREHTRIAELPGGKYDAEKAARILWEDAQWLHENVESSYAGLRYARVVLEDIRAIIATAGYISRDELKRIRVAIATIDLRQRLIDAGVDYEYAEELESHIKQELKEYYQGSLPASDWTLRKIDDLLSKIDKHLRRKDRGLRYRSEARNLINQVSALVGDVAIAVFAITIPGFTFGVQPVDDLRKTAVSAAIAAPLGAMRHRDRVPWRQPDLAPYLRKAYEFVRKQLNRLLEELSKLEGRPAGLRDLSPDEVRMGLDRIKRLAFSIQVGIYETVTLIELTDGWAQSQKQKYIKSGEKLLRICSKIVGYCDNGLTAIDKDSPSKLSDRLDKWLAVNRIDAIPTPLAPRKAAELSKVSRLAEAVGLGNFQRWKYAKWE